MISDSQRAAKGIYGARESRFRGADHRDPVLDCSECGHSIVQMFDGLPVVCRNKQKVRFCATDLVNELWKIHVVADGSSHPPVLRITDRQVTIAPATDGAFPAGYQAALEVRELDLTGGVEKQGLVL